MKIIPPIMAGAALFVAQPALAYDASYAGKVSFVESTYIPDNIVFNLNAGVAGCPAQANLTWTARGSNEALKIANIQGVLATLLTAKAANLTIEVWVKTADCSVEFIHIY